MEYRLLLHRKLWHRVIILVMMMTCIMTILSCGTVNDDDPTYRQILVQDSLGQEERRLNAEIQQNIILAESDFKDIVRIEEKDTKTQKTHSTKELLVDLGAHANVFESLDKALNNFVYTQEDGENGTLTKVQKDTIKNVITRILSSRTDSKITEITSDNLILTRYIPNIFSRVNPPLFKSSPHTIDLSQHEALNTAILDCLNNLLPLKQSLTTIFKQVFVFDKALGTHPSLKLGYLESTITDLDITDDHKREILHRLQKKLKKIYPATLSKTTDLEWSELWSDLDNEIIDSSVDYLKAEQVKRKKRAAREKIKVLKAKTD